MPTPAKKGQKLQFEKELELEEIYNEMGGKYGK